MASSLVVLRTSVLLMFLLLTITGLYVRHITRLSAEAAAQSAASAAAQAATEAEWQCGSSPPPEAVSAAARAALNQVDHLAVQPVSVGLFTDTCNLFAAVTAAPLGTRTSSLHTTATACRSVASAALPVPGSC